MDTLRIGSKGDEVRSLQIFLKKRGYEISVDGIFGEGTEDIVIDFQEQNHLTADGVVGKLTWQTLLDDGVKQSRINSSRYVLTEKNYYANAHSKKNVVLHHTNGWTVVKGTKDRPSMNHFNWWASRDMKVSTAYSIDYKGNIYEHFDPKFWAYHIGLGRARNYLDKQSIGIELCNEGYLVKENGKFYWFIDDIKLPYNRVDDEPVYVEDKWRDYNYFAPYSKEQLDSTIWLVNYLCDKYGISRDMIDDCKYHGELLDGSFKGIYNHANVRKYGKGKPKWDLSPAFDFNALKKGLIK